MSTKKRPKPSYKIWMEYKQKPVLGKGGAEILKQIEKEESISKAAKKLHMSYRYVWNYLQKIEKTLEEPVIKTFRGGKTGGGGAKLTKLGKDLLEEYKCFENFLHKALSDAKYQKTAKSKTNALNCLNGNVLSIEKEEGLTMKIRIQIATPNVMTMLISSEATEKLGLKVGDEVKTVIKSTDIAIEKSDNAS